MSASVDDKITDVRNAARPVSARVTTARGVDGANLACNDLTGWPTASKVHFVVYAIDTSNNPIAGTQIDCSGIVSGNTITNLEVLDGNDNGNSVGDVVEMIPTASWAQDLAEALTQEHDREGVHGAAAFASMKTLILSAVYPVGSIYTNASVNTNPASLLGFGTWVAFAEGRVMVGNGTSDQDFAAGNTGGESNHTLTSNEMPSHTHTASIFETTGGFSNGATGLLFEGGVVVPTTFGTSGPTNATGGGASHNNLQPYIVVYAWKRTA